MTPHPENVARRFLQAWSAGGESLVDELASPDLVVSYTHFAEPLRGAAAFKRALRHTHESFPDLQIAAEDVIATDDTAVVRWSYRATHRSGEIFGIQASGQRVAVQGITIYRIDRGVVLHEEGVVDNLSLMTQLQASRGA